MIGYFKFIFSAPLSHAIAVATRYPASKYLCYSNKNCRVKGVGRKIFKSGMQWKKDRKILNFDHFVLNWTKN